MASITPCCKKNRSLSSLLLAATLFASSLAAGADFKTVEMHPRLTANQLELSGQMDLALSPKVEEALAKGIPIEIVIDIRLERERGLLWNATAGAWKLRRELRFHALSGQYLVRQLEPASALQESFATLPDALRFLGTLSELRFALDGVVRIDSQYLTQLRTSLDIEALPAPLRPVAYTSLDWHLNSGWSQWAAAR